MGNQTLRSTLTNLLEANDVGVAQRAVVDDLPVHILVNLRNSDPQNQQN